MLRNIFEKIYELLPKRKPKDLREEKAYFSLNILFTLFYCAENIQHEIYPFKKILSVHYSTVDYSTVLYTRSFKLTHLV